LRPGARLRAGSDVLKLIRFVEKPDRETAQTA
jgi:mannose-1-phosphate guanylyltransferase